MLQHALDYSIDCIRRNLSELTGFPEFTEHGRWHCVDDGGWVGGHWVGLLWLAYAHTNDDAFARSACAWAARLVPRQFDRTTHDLGFLFELSHILGAHLSFDVKSPALIAARTLLQRYNLRGEFFPAWSTQPGRVIIDTLMNLNLLYWASAETGEQEYARRAIAHACTALTYQVRSNGSTIHVADFDPSTGLFLKPDTHQGLSASSCWSRGQSWAVYGFSECYSRTHVGLFLDAARLTADYALTHLPPDRVPYWDYNSPQIPNDARDSSAAAILAAGLLKLASVDPVTVNATRWRNEATTILGSLWKAYTSRRTNAPSILIHGTPNKPRGFVDQGLIYGDYYFVEAIHLALSNPQ